MVGRLRGVRAEALRRGSGITAPAQQPAPVAAPVQQQPVDPRYDRGRVAANGRIRPGFSPGDVAYDGKYIIPGANPQGKQYFYDGNKVYKDDYRDANDNNIDDREDAFSSSGVKIRDRNGNRIDDRGEGLMQGYRGMEYKDGLTVEEYGLKHNLDPRYSKYWHKGGGQLGNRKPRPLQHHQTYEQKLAQVMAQQQQAPQMQAPPQAAPLGGAPMGALGQSSGGGMADLLGQYNLSGILQEAQRRMQESLGRMQW